MEVKKNTKKQFHGWRDTLFPKKLWTTTFTYWWLISLTTILMFDIFWMIQTTFRPFSYFVFWPVLFLSAFVLSFPSLFLKKGYIQAVWLLFFDLLFIANLMYCRTYYNAIPLYSYAIAGNLADFSSSVAASYKWYFTFLPIFTFCSLIVFNLIKKREEKSPNLLFYGLNVVVLVIIIWIGDVGRGGTLKRMEYCLAYSANLSSSVPIIYSIPGFLIYDYLKTSETISPSTKKEVSEWLTIHNVKTETYFNDSIRNNRIRPENLVIILCESLESWPIGVSIEGKEITPNLNRLINDSTTFYAPNVLTQVGSGRSIEGQLLVMTGLLPMRNQVYAYQAVDNYYCSIPKAMKEAGGESIIITPDKPYVWNQIGVKEAFGFDDMLSHENFKINETVGRQLSDGSLMKQIVEKLKTENLWEEDSKKMILVITHSGHHPFKIPKKLSTISFDEDLPNIIKDYLETAHYTDQSIRILIDYLKSREDWNKTMVVITGDHEGLSSERKTALGNPISKQFVDPNQHTPLIILNSPIPGKYDKPLGQVDIYTTILDLMHWDSYRWKGMGVSVFDPEFPGFAIGSNGNLVGEIDGINDGILQHLLNAKTISDLIIKFDLLNEALFSI